MKKLLSLFLICLVGAVEIMAQIPDKEWDNVCQENYMYYYLTTSFSHDNASLSIEKFKAPRGYLYQYIQDIDYSGPWRVYVFSNPVVNAKNENLVEFKACLYETEDEGANWKKIGDGISGMAAYFKDEDMIRIKMNCDSDSEMEVEFKDPSRPKYVLVNKGTGINVRQTAPSGSVIGKVEAGQILPLLGSKEIETKNSITEWYKIALPDGKEGWTSGLYSNIIDDSIGKKAVIGIPSDALDGKWVYTKDMDGPEGEPYGQENLCFTRKGDRVMVYNQIIYIDPSRMGYQALYLGRIVPGTNRVELYKQMGMMEPGFYEYEENGDFDGFEKAAEDCSDHLYFYLDPRFDYTNVYWNGTSYSAESLESN